jgi:hypothetical protein
LVTFLPISCGQRHQNNDIKLSTTYPVTHYSGGASDFDIVRGAAHDMLRLKRNMTLEASVTVSEE